jgi:hypothetical protein
MILSPPKMIWVEFANPQETSNSALKEANSSNVPFGSFTIKELTALVKNSIKFYA